MQMGSFVKYAVKIFTEIIDISNENVDQLC